MKDSNKTFWQGIAITVLLVLSVFLIMNYQTNKKLSSQQDYYDKKIYSLTEEVNNQLSVLQSLISNLATENKKQITDVLEIINKVQTESQQSIENAVEDLQSEISSIEVSGTGFSDIIKNSVGGVVSVLTNVGQGSGAIITEDGEIVTNFHVISGASRINVMTKDQTTYRVNVIGYDEDLDVALLKISSNETFHDLSFGNSDKVQVGESVVALGNPYGLSFTATQGIVSAIRTGTNKAKYLQIDVPINPGNSGGPIIDASGKIVGLANFRIQGGEGLGFAVTSNEVESVVEDIRSSLP
jgi:S1-C subfamily serine protease